MKLFLGNLPFSASELDVRAWVEGFGLEIQELVLPTDRQTGKPRGFGFVTLPDTADEQEIIDQMNGVQLQGRAVTVNVAKPMEGAGRPNQSRQDRRR